MGRSLKARSDCIERVELAFHRRFARQEDLATEVGLARATVSNFFRRIPIDHLNFEEICWRLELDWQEIADLPEPVPRASTFYVKRPAIEADCCQEISQPGALLRIKAPRQIGKTLLISQILNYAAGQGCRTGDLNLRLAVDTEDYVSLDQFLRFFCTSISLNQGLPNTVDQHWEQNLGNSKLKCTSYFQDCLLRVDGGPLVIALDELDRVYHNPAIVGHFLGMLRAWHESARTSEIWAKLRLIVVYREDYTQLRVYPKT